MTAETPAPLDSEHIEAVASERAVGAGSLTDALATHQQSVEDLPGIENIVYEWRKQYEDPLLARTESAYYLAVPETVWGEFGDALDFDDEMRDAVIEVHRRTVVSVTDSATRPADGVAYVVLDRTR